MHKTAKWLSRCLKLRLHADAKAALAKIYGADTRAAAIDVAGQFKQQFAAYPRATAKITDDLDVLLTFYDSQPKH